MRLYLCHGHINGDTFFRWLGSQADCSKYRAEQTAKGAKRADIKTDEVEVPTNKAGLLEFLNKGQHAP